MKKFKPREGETVLFETGQVRWPAVLMVGSGIVVLALCATQSMALMGWICAGGYIAFALHRLYIALPRRYVVTDRRIVRLGPLRFEQTPVDIEIDADGSEHFVRSRADVSVEYSDAIRLHLDVAPLQPRSSFTPLRLYDGHRRFDLPAVREPDRFLEVATAEIERHRAGRPQPPNPFELYERRDRAETTRAIVVTGAIAWSGMGLFMLEGLVEADSSSGGVRAESWIIVAVAIAGPILGAAVLLLNRRLLRRLSLDDPKVFDPEDR